MSLPSPGDIVADKYRLETLLAVGGMGAVYRARHVVMDTPVALKWLLPAFAKSDEARERFLREARAVAQVRHPNVVHVYDVDTHGDSPFIVMELLEGETFEDLLTRGDLPIRRAIDLLLGAMAGLAAAHQHGIVHRDIKPENIIVVADRNHPEGIAKLIDFGISKSLGGPKEARVTQLGQAVGTPVYMSLEQLTHLDDVDARSDIYSLGVVLYRALTGELPFDGETFPAVVLAIGTTTPPSPKRLRPELPTSLDRIVMRAMARNREDRFPSVEALIAALRAAEQTVHSTPVAVFYPPNETPRAAASGQGIGDRASKPDDDLLTQYTAKSGKYAVAIAVMLCAAALATWAFRDRTTEVRAGIEAVPASAPPAPLPAAAPAIPHGLEPPPDLPARAAPAAARKATRPADSPAPAAKSAPSVASGKARGASTLASPGPAPSASSPVSSSTSSSTPASARPSTSTKQPTATPRSKPTRRSGGLARDDF